MSKKNIGVVKEEYRDTELGMLPKEWDIKYLGDIFDLKQGKQLSSRESKKGKIKKFFLRTSNVFWGRIDISKVDTMFFSKEEFEKLQLKNGDILVCEGGDIGRTALYRGELEEVAYQNHLHRLRPKKDNVDKEFFVFWMTYAITIKQMYIYTANRTTIPNLSGSRLKRFKIPLPPLPEQKRIAYVLSTIQEAKEKTERAIAAAKELKKSLMRHLFKYGPVSLEEAEKVRLKETEIGEIPEEWDVVKLKSLTKKSYSGGTPSTKVKDFWGGDIPWTTSAIIGEDDVFLEKFLRTITDLGFKSSATKIVPKGSLLVGTRVGVGKAVVTTFDVAISQDLTALELDFKKGLPLYVAYLFKTYSIQKWFENNKRGATIKGVPRKDLMSLQIPLPPLHVQKEIASILSAVDEKIEKLENKKKALEELFKSMLENLMTARLRVNHLEV